MRGARRKDSGTIGRLGVRAAGRRASFCPVSGNVRDTLEFTCTNPHNPPCARRLWVICPKRAQRRGRRPGLSRYEVDVSSDRLLCPPTAHSSSGLGRRPLTAVARVRIPYAPFMKSPAQAGFSLSTADRSTTHGGPQRRSEAHDWHTIGTRPQVWRDARPTAQVRARRLGSRARLLQNRRPGPRPDPAQATTRPAGCLDGRCSPISSCRRALRLGSSKAQNGLERQRGAALGRSPLERGWVEASTS